MSLLSASLAAPAARAQGADSLYLAGRKAFQERLFRLARDSFSQLVRDFPEDPQADDADYHAAVCSFYLGEYERCLEPLRTFERRHPRSPWLSRIQYWRGGALFRLERFAEALAALDRQVGAYPQEAWFRLQALLLKGGALERLERPQEAAAAYGAIVQDPAAAAQGDLLPAALFRLGGVQMRLEAYGEARRLFSRLLLEHPGAAEAAEAVFFLAECQYFLGELEEAGKRYARFLEGGKPGGGRSAEGVGAAAAWSETARYRLARIALRQGRPEAALEALSRLEQDFPEGRFRREVPALRAEALFTLKRFGDSAAAWREALRTAPADGSAADGSAADGAERQSLAFNLAQAAQEAGDAAGALEAWRQAREGPDRGLRLESLYREGLLQREAGRAEEALRVLRAFVAEVDRSAAPRGASAQAAAGDGRLEEALRLQADLLLRAADNEAAAAVYTRLLLEWPDSPSREEYLFRRANAFLSAGDEPRAMKDFQSLAGDGAAGGGARGGRASPYLAESLYALGYSYASGREYARALPYFERALAAGGPRELTGRLLLARGVCLYNLERYDEALETFRRLAAGPGKPAAEPWTGEGLFHLGRTLYRMERMEEAVEGFRQAAAALGGRSEGAEALFWQGTAELRLGRLEPARDSFLRLVREYPREPRLAEALYRAALCESRLGRPAEAASLLERAREPAASDPDLRVQVLYERGWALFQLGRRREANASFDALRKEEAGRPLAAEGYFRMAEADYQRGGWKEALDGFKRAQGAGAGGETAANALYWGGMSALRLERTGEALQGFWGYLKARPDGPYRDPALARLREALAGQGGGGDAARKFYRQMEADEEVPLPLRNQARLEYARVLFEQESEEVAAVLERIRSTRPAEPVRGEADLLTGRVYQRGGELERARQVFTGLAGGRQDRIGASAQLGVGQVLEELGRKEEAAAEYLKVGFLYPGFADLAAEALYRAGRAYEALGRTAEARQLDRRLRDEHPGSPWSKKLDGEDGGGPR